MLIEEKNFKDIFDDENLKLPLQRDAMDFVDNLKIILSTYSRKLVETKLNPKLIEEVGNICESLVNVFNEYYSVSSMSAYEIFEDIMISLEDHFVRNIKLIDEFMPVLYRTRVVGESRKYKKNEIFHVPFSNRTYVGGARYSISGYPCLYLSTTLELCHYESNGKKNNLKIFSSFKYKSNDKFDYLILDMSKKPQDIIKEINDNNIDIRDIEAYYYIYPLLASASFIKPSQDQKFVPEYIIPQFIFQWLRTKYKSENKVCGIRYFSSKDKRNSNRGYNYVFPTKYPSKKKNYCDVLINNFEMTDPVLVDNDIDNMDDLSWLEKELLKEKMHFML